MAKKVADDPILLTQVVFSGILNQLNSEEQLAFLSCLDPKIRPAKGHEAGKTDISFPFRKACDELEK